MAYHDLILAEPSLIDYWRGEETSGTSAADSQGSLTGTYQSGVTLGGAGLDGNAPSYPGNISTGYMSAASTGMPTGASSRTLELWFNTTHAQTDGSGFVGLCGYGAGSTNQLFALYFGSDASAKTLVFGDFGSNLNVTLGLPYNDGAWHHYAATYDGTTLRLYYDGDLVGTKTVTYGTASGTTFFVGRWSGSNGPFNGAVDEVALYNSTLSADSIYAHYLAGPRTDVRAKATRPKPLQPRVNPRWGGKLLASAPLHDVGTSGSPGGKTYDPVLRGFRTINSPAAWTASQDSWGPRLTPSNGTGVSVNMGVGLSGKSEFTIAALCTLTSASPALSELWASETGVTGNLRVTVNGSSVGLAFQVGTDGSFTNLLAPPPPLNQPVLITARLTSAGVRSIWYGTTKVAERTDAGISVPVDTTNALGLGSGGGGLNRQWPGSISGGMVFYPALTDAEILELNRDFFDPVRYGRMSVDNLVSFTGVVNSYSKSASDSATFTGKASSTGMASSSATFSDAATQTRKAVAGVAQSATFNMTAVASRESVASATGAALFSDEATRTAKVNQAASDTFTFSMLAGLTHQLLASDTATFSDVASDVSSRLKAADDAITFFDDATVKGSHRFASDSFFFTEAAEGRSRDFWPVSASDRMVFGNFAFAYNTVHFPILAADLMIFSDEALSVSDYPETASDSFIFTDIARARRALDSGGTTVEDTMIFTDIAESNHFYARSASDEMIFTDLAEAVRSGPNASDLIIFTDRAEAVDQLPSGELLICGDRQLGLRTQLISVVSGSCPFSYAESTEGYVLIANGIDPVIAWDGVSDSAWYAGLTPPDTVVFGDPGGTGLLTGRRYAFTRWVDARGNFSNLSPISDPIDLGRDGLINNVKYDAQGVVTIWSRAHGLTTGDTVIISGVDERNPHGVPLANGTWNITVVDDDSFTLDGLHILFGDYKSGGVWTKGSLRIDYSNVQVPTDGKIARRQILRNLEGDATVFYVDIDTTDLASTSFSSTRTDEDLATSDKVPLKFEDGEPNSQRFYPPPAHKKALASYAGRIWATADMVYSRGNVAVTLGSQVVQGIGTNWTAAMAGRLLYVDGQAGQPIQQVLQAQQFLVLETGYKGQTSPMAFYTIRPAPIERRLVYFSEPGLPEAWPSWNAFALPESSDEIVGLFVLRSFLYVVKERNIYKFSYREDPGTDGYVFPVAARGCVNNRCYAQVEGVYYVLDEQGVYIFDGDQAQPISQDVSALFKPDGTSTYRIDWSSDRTLWSAAHDPSRYVVRWFVDLFDQPTLTHAICYDYRGQQWWLEQYPEAVSASALAVVNGYRQSVLGTTARRVFAPGQGTLDGIAEDSSGTLRGTATSADSISLTDANGRFPACVAGVPLVIVSGTGAGQYGIISEGNAHTLTLVDPWPGDIPDETSVYQVGGVRWLWRSGWRRLVDDEAENPRDLEVVFKPTTNPGSLNARVYFDHSTSPETWAADVAQDGITIAEDDANITIELSTPRGYTIHRMGGHRDPYGYGHRYCAVELEGVQAVDPQRVFSIILNGVE